MKEVVDLLKLQNKTISTMESCTGGAVCNAITNIEGASNVLKFSAITYSNEYKIKMGVDKNIIDNYTVYSMQTAEEMSKNISLFANANFGIGITGQFNVTDENNITKENDIIYISIYNKDKKTFYDKQIKAIKDSREHNKQLVVDNVIKMLIAVLKER